MFIKRKKKKCLGCLTEQYIYGKGLCSRCYPKPPLSKKRKKPDEAFGFKSEKELFLHLWKTHKTCAISGEDLTKYVDSVKFWSLFAHVIPKGNYPEYRLNPDNIIVVSPLIHALYDFGTQEQRDKSQYDFTPLYTLKEKLKHEYTFNRKSTESE